MVPLDELLPIDKWAIATLNDLIEKAVQSYNNYEFHIVYHSIHNFCVVDMSNFYLDVLKDRLYTEKKDGKSRKAAQTAIYLILNAMTRMLAPILAYTDDVKKAIEPLVKAKTVKGSLETKVTLAAGGEKLAFLQKAQDELAAAFIVSEVTVTDNGGELAITVEKAEGEKCERCWTISKTVGPHFAHAAVKF